MDAQYLPLSKVTVDFLDTPAAAHYLGMQVCTLRNWSIGKGSHPIQGNRTYLA